MDVYRLSIWLHIVLGVVLSGQALFWAVMLAALRQRHDSVTTRQWLTVARGARWPHVVVPYAMRLPLPLVAWLTLALLAATGMLIISATRVPEGIFWSVKWWLLAGVAFMQLVLSWRPVAAVIVGNLALTLATMIVSAWLVRG
jgi:hypothetical protein